MPLIPPTPALRSFRNRRHDVAKIALVVPPGHELIVTEEVAAQLDGRVFLDLDAKAAPPATVAAAPVAEVEEVAPADGPIAATAKRTKKS